MSASEDAAGHEPVEAERQKEPEAEAEDELQQQRQRKGRKGRRKGALLAIGASKNLLTFSMYALAYGTTFSLPAVFNACPPSLVTLSVCTHAYLWILQQWRFRGVAKREREEGVPKNLFKGGRLLQVYSAFMGLGSVVLPWILCLNNPLKYMRLLGPHLYLVMYQIVLEAASSSWAKPVRLLVPIAFNSFRIPQLERWRSIVFDPYAPFSISAAKDFGSFDKAFCVVSGAAWCLNLLAFLIPYVYPSMLDQIHRPQLAESPSTPADSQEKETDGLGG